MTFGRNPNSVPYGVVGRTNVPLPGTVVNVVKPTPIPVHKSDVADGTVNDTVDNGNGASLMDDAGTEEPSGNGILDKLAGPPAQPGDDDNLLDGDASQDDFIYGTDDGSGNGIGNDVIEGDDLGSGEMTDAELDKIIEGDDDEMDAVIEGRAEPEMTDAEFNQIVYGTSDGLKEHKAKKSIYRASGTKPRNVPQRTANTGLGMTQ